MFFAPDPQSTRKCKERRMFKFGKLERTVSVLLTLAVIFSSSAFDGILITDLFAADDTNATAYYYLDGELSETVTSTISSGDEVSASTFETKTDFSQYAYDSGSYSIESYSVTEGGTTTYISSNVKSGNAGSSTAVTFFSALVTELTTSFSSSSGEITVTGTYKGFWENGGGLYVYLSSSSTITSTTGVAVATIVEEDTGSWGDSETNWSVTFDAGEISNIESYSYIGLVFTNDTSVYLGADDLVLTSVTGSGVTYETQEVEGEETTLASGSSTGVNSSSTTSSSSTIFFLTCELSGTLSSSGTYIATVSYACAWEEQGLHIYLSTSSSPSTSNSVLVGTVIEDYNSSWSTSTTTVTVELDLSSVSNLSSYTHIALAWESNNSYTDDSNDNSQSGPGNQNNNNNQSTTYYYYGVDGGCTVTLSLAGKTTTTEYVTKTTTGDLDTETTAVTAGNYDISYTFYFYYLSSGLPSSAKILKEDSDQTVTTTDNDGNETTTTVTCDVYYLPFSDISIEVGGTYSLSSTTKLYYVPTDNSEIEIWNEAVTVTWDKSGIDADTVGVYTATATFTGSDGTVYTTTITITVAIGESVIIAGTETEDPGAFTDSDGDYDLADWDIFGEGGEWPDGLSLATGDCWLGDTDADGNNGGESSSYSDAAYYSLSWSTYNATELNTMYVVLSEYDRYLAPGTYTLTFYAVGSGTTIGAYFDGVEISNTVYVNSGSSYNLCTIEFEVEEPILQTVIGIYFEFDGFGESNYAWGYLDGLQLTGYQYDEESTEEIAVFEQLYLETEGYDYIDLDEDSDGNPETSTTYDYVFNATDTENVEKVSSWNDDRTEVEEYLSGFDADTPTDALYSTIGFFDEVESSEVFYEFSTGSAWSASLESNDWSTEPASWGDMHLETWKSDTLSSSDILYYEIPILPAGTYTFYYSVMGGSADVQAYIDGTAVGETHGVVYWDYYQYYSYTFTVSETEFDYKVGIFYDLDAGGYVYTDCMYVLGTETITEEMVALYQVYLASKSASEVTYDSGVISDISMKYESVADAGTFDLNSQFTGTSDDDGRVVTDKSVTLAAVDFDGDGVNDYAEPEDTNFTVALSALSQTYDYSLTTVNVSSGIASAESAADVVFVLDISMSMFYYQDEFVYQDKLLSMVDEVNDAIDQIFKINEDNRVAVVVYSDTSGTGTIIKLTGKNEIEKTEGYDYSGVEEDSEDAWNEIKSGNKVEDYLTVEFEYDSDAVQDSTFTISGMSNNDESDSSGGIVGGKGTFIQSGISYATEVLTNDNDVDEVTRSPYIFLLTDGEADYYSISYNTVPITSATNSDASYSAETGYYTILTANYAQNMITEFYQENYGFSSNSEAAFYTVGFELSSTTYSEYAEAIINPSSLSSASGTLATGIKSLLDSGDVYSDDYDYVTEYYETSDDTSLSSIISSFTSAISATTSLKTESLGERDAVNQVTIDSDGNAVGTYSDLSDYILFSDYIGEQMEVTSYPAISYNGTIYYPSTDDENFDYDTLSNAYVPWKTTTGTDDNSETYTDVTYSYYAEVYPYNDYDGSEDSDAESANLSKITVTVRTYDDSLEQTVFFYIPSELVPAYTYDSDAGEFVNDAIPIRLIYTVGLDIYEYGEDGAETQAVEEGTKYYTNNWTSTNTSDWGTSTAVFVPSSGNPYYYTTEDWTADVTETNDDGTESTSTYYVTTKAIDYGATVEEGEESTTQSGYVLKLVNGVDYVIKQTKKTKNATGTSAYSYYTDNTNGTTEVSGYAGTTVVTEEATYTTITAHLGNNGYIVLSELQSLEYYVWLGNEATLDIGENVDDVDEVTDVEYNGTAAEESSDIEISGSDEDTVLNYTQTGDVGDYTYTITYNDTDGNELEATLTVHVYDVADDVYVLDYGLPVSLADTSYDNGMFQNDTLTTDDTDMVATFTGIGTYEDVTETTTDEDGNNTTTSTGETTINYSTSATGVQGVLTAGASEIDIYTEDTDVNVTETDSDGNETTATTAHDAGEIIDSDYDIVYTPTNFMSDIDTFGYQLYVIDGNSTALVEYSNGVTMNADMNVMPATSVYYEDNFSLSSTTNTNATAGFVYTADADGGSVSTVSKGSANTYQSNSLTTVYGYDDTYSDDTYYSSGSATVLTAAYGETETSAMFTFKGTGFDLYARATTNTARILVRVYTSSDEETAENTEATTEEKTDYGELVASYTVNTYYQNGALYQVPVISIEGLDYDEYTAVITIISTEYQTYVVLDGVRIYNPLGVSSDYSDETSSAYLDSEIDASTYEMKDLIFGDGFTITSTTTTTTTDSDSTDDEETTTTTTYTVTQGSGVAAAFYAYDGSTFTTSCGSYVETYDIESNISKTSATVSSDVTTDLYSYFINGSNNEAYLGKNAGVLISVDTDLLADIEDYNSCTFQIAAKSISGTPTLTAYVVTSSDDDKSLAVSGSTVLTKEISTSSEMYYEIDLELCLNDLDSIPDNMYVYIMNSGDGTDSDSTILSLTNIKINGYGLETLDAEDAGEDIEGLSSSVVTTMIDTLSNYLIQTGALSTTTDTSTSYGEVNSDTTTESGSTGGTDTNSDDKETTEPDAASVLLNAVLAQLASSTTDGTTTYSIRFLGIIDSLEYNDVGFYISVYDSEGNALQSNSKKIVTSVYSSITANGTTIDATSYANQLITSANLSETVKNAYFYSYKYTNISADSTYYFEVYTYVNNDGVITKSDSAKIYKLDGESLSVVDSLTWESSQDDQSET